MRLKNSDSRKIYWVLFLLFFLFKTENLKAQHRYAIVTLRCDSANEHCDTLSIEHFNPQKKLQKKVKFGNPSSTIEYNYNQQGILISKVHRDSSGLVQKTNRIYSDSSGSWHTDSLIDKSGKLLFVFRRTPLQSENRYQVEWFYKNDDKASSRQIIQYDTLGNELSNSTCYSADNCLTYRFIYSGNRKIKSELWVLNGSKDLPVLRETEDFYYAEGDWAVGSVRFEEPAHLCTSRFRYVVIDEN